MHQKIACVAMKNDWEVRFERLAEDSNLSGTTFWPLAQSVELPTPGR